MLLASHVHLLQDDEEIFSTPPTTPLPMTPSPRSSASSSTAFSDAELAGGVNPDVLSKPLSRRSSRPTSLHISETQGWNQDVQLVANSPDAARRSQTDGDDCKNDDKESVVKPTSPRVIESDSQAPRDSSLQSQIAARTNAATSVLMPSSVIEQGTITSGAASSSSLSNASTITQRHFSQAGGINKHSPHSQPHPKHSPAPKSPCFVHSYLDKGASLADWLKGKQTNMMGVPSPLSPRTAPPPPLYSTPSQNSIHHSSGKHGIPHHPHTQAMHPAMPLPQPQLSPGSSPDSEEYDEDEDGASITRQLAETAVGVREMSKQLGRTRVRSNIQNVLIVTKARDNRLIKLTRELALYLMQKPRYGGRGLVVYVDNQLRYSKRFDAAGIERDYPELFVPFPRRRSSSSNSLASMSNNNGSEFQMNQEGQLRYWTSEMCNKSPHLFDFVVTLGGDGTVLFTSWLFQRIVPPILPFALGSLGFLTNFDFADHRAVMDSVLDNGIRVNLRMRFTCTVYRAVAPEPGKGRRAVKKAQTGEIMMRNLEKDGWEALEGGWSESAGVAKEGKKAGKDKEIMCFTTRPVESFEVINDLVVDRGPSPYVSLLELFGDEHHMTTVQADGLTVSTPTGSTAYSLSAGGSLVHPEIPALLITPICPHTLSFRPMLLPDSMELRICVPFNSRSTAWASFDGRGRVELKQGDHIKVTASKYPFPTVCADKQSTDWFHAISRTLKWNERERQKSFVVVEEGPEKAKTRKDSSSGNVTAAVTKPGIPEHPEDEDDEEDVEEDEVSDEEEEKFDIDDSSAPEASVAPSSTDLTAMAKAQEEVRTKQEAAQARVAAFALAQGTEIQGGSSNHRERSDTVRSGIQTPDRFAGAHPHPPRVSPRHVSFGETSLASGASTPGGDSDAIMMNPSRIHAHASENGDRDHIHSPQMLSSGRSRIPRDRDLEMENAKTPTLSNWAGRNSNSPPSPPFQPQRASRSRESSSVRRAFAVWGQDESDSNTSDSDV